MNNFTKEELGIIACNLCVNPKTKSILRKLALMIDNYCEHETLDTPAHLWKWHLCSKCGKEFKMIISEKS